MSIFVGSYSDALLLRPNWKTTKPKEEEVKVEENKKSRLIRLPSGAVKRVK